MKFSSNSLIKDFEYKQDKVDKERKVSFTSRNPTYKNGKKKVYSNDLLSRFVRGRDVMKKFVSGPPI